MGNDCTGGPVDEATLRSREIDKFLRESGKEFKAYLKNWTKLLLLGKEHILWKVIGLL